MRFELIRIITDISSVKSIKGRRRTNEDRFLSFTFENAEIFGVFDGHGGQSAVETVFLNFQAEFIRHFESQNNISKKD